jgi:isopentenyl-diphosphate delta-isomerase
MNDRVILVNENDEPQGTMEKMEAHEKGVLHRAFSVFIFNKKGQLLLQQRSPAKYHGGLLWTNTCCSHPYPGEATRTAANRRLMEEMGFESELEEIFSFIYQAEVENGLTEHEYDHVFAGEYEGKINANALEVMDYRFLDLSAINDWLEKEPQQFTTWFRIALPRIQNWWISKYGHKR